MVIAYSKDDSGDRSKRSVDPCRVQAIELPAARYRAAVRSPTVKDSSRVSAREDLSSHDTIAGRPIGQGGSLSANFA